MFTREKAAQEMKNGKNSKENACNLHFMEEQLSFKRCIFIFFPAKVEKLLRSKKITLAETFILLQRQPFSKGP